MTLRYTIHPTSLVLEALADLGDALLRHELSARVEIGGGDTTVDLQIELHHRPEALQEGLLPERAGQIATGECRLLCRAEVEAIGADLAGFLGLSDGLCEGRGEHVIAG